MNWPEKFAGAVAVLGVALVGTLLYVVWDAKQEYANLADDLAETQKTIAALAVQLEQETALSEENYVDLDTTQVALSEKIAVLEESIDPKESRWAKVKRVRDAVQKTYQDHKIPTHMSTIDLTRFSGAVVDWSEQYDVSIPLILAMIRQESAFNPRAKSHAGALGVMQVMPRTAREEIAPDLGTRHYSLFKVNDAVRFGTYYIMKLLDTFDGDVSLAVRAYNCGPTYTRKVVSGEYQDYPSETKDYVKKILGDEETEGYVKYYENMGL